MDLFSNSNKFNAPLFPEMTQFEKSVSSEKKFRKYFSVATASRNLKQVTADAVYLSGAFGSSNLYRGKLSASESLFETETEN